jgi:membrane-bound lytic murein transglycosylase D
MMRFYKILMVAAGMFMSLYLFSQPNNSKTPASDDPSLQEIERILVDGYLHHYCFSADSAVLNGYGYEKDELPSFTEEVIRSRMEILDNNSPFHLVYNSDVQKFIDLYAVRRKDVTSKVLGVSELYFPMIEEYLTRYNIPLELKYLAIVESALNTSAISKAGAGGMWQFMPTTARVYGLNISSYCDDRFDPHKSTNAACQYLKYLYGLFGNWELVLAAYNSGPGNVTKAIRRAGGSRDFWYVKQYLPKETQNYVPAFIAVNYIMGHVNEYNIFPKKPNYSCYELDTVAVKGYVHFDALSKIINLTSKELSSLNARYKLSEVPKNGEPHFITLPINKIGLYLQNENLIYQESALIEKPKPIEIKEDPEEQKEKVSEVVKEEKQEMVDQWKTHKVKKGETLTTVAKKYGVSTKDLKTWNKLKSGTVKTGQSLKVKVQVQKNKKESVTPKENNKKSPPEKKDSKKSKTYIVKSGDSLSKIATKNKTTVAQLKKLNPKLSNNLKVGQKVIISK